MATHIAIGFVVLVLLAFELNSTQAALLIGQEVAGPAGARHIQDAITPPTAAKLAIVLYLALLGCVIASFVLYGWLIGLLSIPGLFVALGLLKQVIPSPSSAFFRNAIVRSMVRRHADFVKSGDSMRAAAMADLLDQVGCPVPSHLKPR